MGLWNVKLLAHMQKIPEGPLGCGEKAPRQQRELRQKQRSGPETQARRKGRRRKRRAQRRGLKKKPRRQEKEETGPV